MKVFTLAAPEGFEWVLPVDEDQFGALRFDGTTRKGSWVPIEMQRLATDGRGRPLQESDFPSCSGGDMLVLRQRAVDVLGRMLEDYGELLPLICGEGDPLWTFNVTRLVDALDEQRSDVLRSAAGAKILRVNGPVFRAERLAGVHLFKLSQMPRGLIYVTEPFAAIVKSHELRGMAFTEVWAPN